MDRPPRTTTRSRGGRIFFCGDCHGHFDHVSEAAQAFLPAAVIFLGDLESPAPLDQVLAPILQHTAVWWIQGNHDTDREASYDNLYGSSLADRNLHGRVVEVAGMRIAGLGGVFREKIWSPPTAPQYESAEDFTRQCGRGNRWRGGLPLRHRSTIFPDEYQRLGRQRADVLVTHEAPGTHRNGFPALGDLAQKLAVRTMLHGHHHEHYEAQLGNGTKVIGVGLRGIVDLDGQTVVEEEAE